MDIAVVIAYLLLMILVGWWGKRRVSTESDYLVAGRRLGPVMYMGTLSAVVLGGASTIGGVGLGYEYGLSGMWLVIAIGCGILLLSLAFAPLIQRLRVYTVAQALELRYGPGTSLLSGLVMWAYTLLLSATSTIAYGTILTVLLDIERIPAIILGGSIVLLYSALGGMWSITLTDILQFVITTVGMFFVLLPFAWWRAGGVDAIRERAGEHAFSLTAIGGGTILTYFVIYFFGLLIGQDIWQRVFTARSPQVARWGGVAAGLYCLAYAVVGALVGASGQVLVPGLAHRDDAFVAIAEKALPVGLTGLVLAAALAAVMSTASGSLIATATVARQDIATRLRHGLRARTAQGEGAAAGSDGDEVAGSRAYVVVFGLLVIVLACVLGDVVAALTLAYDVLVGGLLVAIIGGLIWRRGTASGALASMAVGTLATLVTMAWKGDIYANEPIYAGLALSALVYVVVSLLTPPTDPAVLAAWDARSRAGRAPQQAGAGTPEASA